MPSSGIKRSLERDDVSGTNATNDADHDGVQNIMHDDSSGEEGYWVGSYASSTTITNVLDTIGIEVYKFLHPNDLFSFSLANHHVFNEVSKGLIQACLRQLPSNFGSNGRDHVIVFNNRHSFLKKEHLLDHLLDKIQIADLKLVGNENQTMEDSLMRARDVFSHQAGAKFVSLNDDLPEHLRTEYTSAGYHYEKENKGLATSRSKYILSRMAMEGKMSKHITIVKTWINYILSQKQIVAGSWLWSVRHRNLDFQGVEGKGVMISSPNAIGEEMEICWTRMTASRV